MFGPEENTMLGLEDAVRIMLGIDQPPNMVDPYPREAAPLIILLKDRKIGWDEDSHKSVDRVAHVLAQNPGTAWIDNPPSQQFAKDRNVTATILHAYEKHRAFVAAGCDYEEVDEAFWSDAWVSKECYRSMFLDPWIIYELETCPICG